VSLERKLKIALDESRLLILGAQVLFGFQFNGIFQELFEELPRASQVLACAGLLLTMLTVGLLIAPSMQHRIVEQGQGSPKVLALATLFAEAALLPLAIALALDVFLAMERVAGASFGINSAGTFFAVAIMCWYALEVLLKRRRQPVTTEKPKAIPLETQVDQLLTEARVIIPGAQALLGFQLTVTFMHAFQQLPTEAKWAHAAALCCVGLAVILLMAPASLHRISFGGEDDPEFVKIGSAFVVAAPIPLALGIAPDTYVAAGRALQSELGAALIALAAIAVLGGLWYGYPLWRRKASAKISRRP